MRWRHVDVEGSQIQFQFVGKSGVKHTVDIQKPVLEMLLNCYTEKMQRQKRDRGIGEPRPPLLEV